MGRSLPPLNSLKAFEAAARLGSLTAAARELGVSQVAVSRQVRSLEDHLGVALFTRSHRQVDITREGRQLHGKLTHAFDEIDAAVRRVSRRGRKDVLSLQSYMTFSQRWLIPRLPMFQSAHPHIEVRLTSSREPADFSSRTLDAAIRAGCGDWPDVGVDRLIRPELVVVCSPALQAATPLRVPADLAKVTLLHSLARPDYWATWLKAAGVTRVDAYRGLKFESSALVYEAAMQGLGVAIGLDVLVEQNIRDGVLTIPFAKRHALDEAYYLTWPKDRTPSPALRHFHAWLRRQIETEVAASAARQKSQGTG
jgi:LysR family glycine cleavage system transcriptional activator